MGQIQQARYDHLLRRTTAQTGGGSKVGNALEDLFPTLDVERAPMELLRASGWKFGMGRIDRTSAPLALNAHQLFNPVDSRHLLVLTDLVIGSLTTHLVQFGPAFVALTDASVAGAERDTRAGSISATVGLMQRQDDGAASAFGIIRILANTPFEMHDQNGLAVLAPGTGFIVTQTAFELRLFTSWLWRERVAEPEELDF